MELSRGMKLDIARRNALYQKLHKGTIERDIIDESDEIPLGADLASIGGGVGSSCYLDLMKNLAVFFFLGSVILIPTMMLCSSFIGFGFDINDISVNSVAQFFVFLSPGNIVYSLWMNENFHEFRPNLTYLLIPELVFSIFFVFYNRCCTVANISEVAEQVDGKLISTGDFSLMVEGIDPHMKDAAVVFRHFNKLKPVHSVLLCFDSREAASIQQKINEATVQYYTCIECEREEKVLQENAEKQRKNSSSGTKLADDMEYKIVVARMTRLVRMDLSAQEKMVNFTYQNTLEKGCCGDIGRFFGYTRDKFYWQDKIIEYVKERELVGDPGKKEKTTGIAFVIFQSARSAHAVAEMFQKGTHYNLCGAVRKQEQKLSLNGKNLTVSACMEPSDVVFTNLGQGFYGGRFRSFLMDLFTIILVAAAVYGVFMMNQLKDTMAQADLIGLAISVITTVLSTIIKLIVPYLTDFTKPTTHTRRVASSIFRMSFTGFLLSIIMPLIFSFFPFLNDVNVDNSNNSFFFMSYQWWIQVAFNFLLNIFVDLLLGAVFEGLHLVPNLLRIFPAWFFACCRSQYNLNVAYTPDVWPLEFRMSNMVKIVVSGMFVAPFMPTVIPLLFIFFFLQYWIDKHSLLHWYKKPAAFSYEVVESAISYVSLGFHLHSIAKIVTYFFIFYVNAPDQNNIPTSDYNIGFALLGFYAFFVLISLFQLTYTLCRDGCFKKYNELIDDDVDETAGKGFILFEDHLKTFLDAHPCYNEPDTHVSKKPKNALGSVSRKSKDIPVATTENFVSTAPLQQFQYYSYWTYLQENTYQELYRRGGRIPRIPIPPRSRPNLYKKPDSISEEEFGSFGINKGRNVGQVRAGQGRLDHLFSQAPAPVYPTSSSSQGGGGGKGKKAEAPPAKKLTPPKQMKLQQKADAVADDEDEYEWVEEEVDA